MKYNPTYIIIGYSVDAAVWAREIALTGAKVKFFQTGKLGHPLDEIRDYISYEDVIKLKTLGVDVPFKKLVNGTYMFLPFDQLKFVNSRNGLISYPLNRSSFESAEEWEQMELCMHKIDDFRKELEQANNFLNIYKNFFPKWLYDCFLKYIGMNKWGGIRQSKFTKVALAKEVNLSCLDDTSTGVVYRPKNGYEDLCEKMLEHDNIKCTHITLPELKKFIIKRHKNTEIALMDNRVDYLCNYTYGSFDRVDFLGERMKDKNLEEFIDINDGIVFTPMSDYFCITNEEGKVIKIKSSKVEKFDCVDQSVILPTTINAKMYNEYRKMMNLYSRKVLNLDNFLSTTIK